MLRNKIFEWIWKTFGESRHGDNINFAEIVSFRKDKKQKKDFRITEIKLALQTKYYDPIDFNPVVMEEWRKQLNGITNNSLRHFHCDFSKILETDRIDPEKFRSGKSFLLSLSIFYKEEI